MGLAHSPRIVTDGLVLCLDAANVKSYPGSGTTWTDLSGNGANGTLNNGPTFATTNGGSIVFDGSNDDMTAPASLAMSSFTMNYWIYLDDTINWAARFDITSTNIPGNVNGRLLFYRSSTTTLQFYQLFPDLIASAINVTDANTLFTGKWKYVSLSSSTVASNTTMSVYIDGVLNNSLVVAKTPTATSSSIYFMRNVGATNPTKGKLAAIQVYNRALSATEIQQNFNALRGRFGL